MSKFLLILFYAEAEIIMLKNLWKKILQFFFISKFSKIFCIKYIGRFFKRIFSIFVPVSDNHYYLLIWYPVIEKLK